MKSHIEKLSSLNFNLIDYVLNTILLDSSSKTDWISLTYQLYTYSKIPEVSKNILCKWSKERGLIAGKRLFHGFILFF